MSSYSAFDKLVAGLSSNERRDMLQRIASAARVIEPGSVPDDEQAIDVDESYQRMGFFRRVLIALVALFTGRELLSVVESHLLRDLGRKVDSVLPHGLDTVQEQLRPGAMEDFRALADHARRFSGILGRVMGRERRAFVAFLAGLHAPEAQERLVRDTDSFRIGTDQPELREADVKRRALNEVDEVAATLAPAVRQRIYTDVRSLHQLLGLSSFAFDRTISTFQPVAGGEPVPAPLGRIVDDLSKLGAIFEGLRQEPSSVLFEALALFQEQDRLTEDDEAVELFVQQNLERFETAFAGVQGFARRYPLNDLVRIAHANIHYRPSPPGGGEDWFAQWKSFWRERVEDAHRRYAHQLRMDSISERARTGLELVGVEPFPGYPPSGLDDPARHGLSMGLLRAVMENVYRKAISEPVASLYRDGEFYKADNRADLDRAWHAVQRVQTDVANFEARLRPAGDLGMSWAQTLVSSVPAEEARNRQTSLVASIDGDSSALLHRAADTFRLLGEILQGVLYGTVGGRYDTIGNLGELGGRSSDAFVKRLEVAHVRCKATADLLTDLQHAETSIERT